MSNQTLPPRSSPTPDHDPTAPRGSGRVSRFLSAHPRRSLLAVFLFVLVAGFFGGPLAGSLDASGGFASDDADSVRAVERIEAATGQAPGTGIVIVVDTPQGLPADTARVQEVTDDARGRVRRRPGDLPDHPRRSRHAGLAGRHAGPGARHPVRRRRRRGGRRGDAGHLRRSGRRHRRRLGGGRPPARQHRHRGPRPRRAAGLPAAGGAVADLLPRPRGPDAARRRGHDRARHVPGPHRRQPGLRAEHLRAQPRHGPRHRPGHRLHAVPGHPLPRGAGGAGPDRRRDPHHDAYGGPHRRLLRQHGRGRPGRAHGLPPGVHQVHGPRRRHGRRRRRHRRTGDLARDVRSVGREARRAGSRAEAPSTAAGTASRTP